MDDELVRVESVGGVRVLTLSRPPVNALNGALLEAIGKAVDAVVAGPAVRVVVLSGGRRAFSAGADVREFALLPPGARRPWIGRGQRLCDRIEALNRPVVAAIEGLCFGGGLELAMACHLRVAADGAQLGQPEVKLGIPPGFGGTQRLPRLVSPGTAYELLLTGEPIDAERAYQVGLVNRRAAKGEALTVAVELATRLAERSASALASILALVRPDLTAGLRRELGAIDAALDSPDGREGTAAFVEKRVPRFRSTP